MALPLPTFLLPETTIQKNGTSAPIELQSDRPVLITLGVLETVEQESLLFSLEGSEDAAQWLPDPLVTFPEKFYPGVAAIYLDPALKNIRYLRASWKLNRWGRGDKTPSFRLYVFAEEV